MKIKTITSELIEQIFSFMVPLGFKTYDMTLSEYSFSCMVTMQMNGAYEIDGMSSDFIDHELGHHKVVIQKDGMTIIFRSEKTWEMQTFEVEAKAFNKGIPFFNKREWREDEGDKDVFHNTMLVMPFRERKEVVSTLLPERFFDIKELDDIGLLSKEQYLVDAAIDGGAHRRILQSQKTWMGGIQVSDDSENAWDVVDRICNVVKYRWGGVVAYIYADWKPKKQTGAPDGIDA